MVVSVPRHDHHPPVLEQAPVRALDPDGAGIVTVGTAAFVIAAGACWLSLDSLVAAGQEWWLGVCLVGVGLGLIGSVITLSRHRRRKSAQTDEDTAEEVEAAGSEDPVAPASKALTPPKG
jgi:hypothetical protein